MRSILQLFRFLRPYRWQAIVALILLLGMVGADLLIPRLTQRIIDEGIAKGNMQAIWGTALAMLAAALVSALFAIGNNVLSVRTAQGFAADVRSALVRKVQGFSFGNLDRLQTGQLIVRSTSDKRSSRWCTCPPFFGACRGVPTPSPSQASWRTCG